MQQRVDLHRQLIETGYFPEIVGDVVEQALADEELVAFYVHPDVAFGDGTIGRHLSVLLLTPSRLILTHVDDHAPDGSNQAAVAATTEAVRLRDIKTVSVSRVFGDPSQYHPGKTPDGVRLGISWGGTRQFEAEVNDCGDPSCEANHGYAGVMTSEDVLMQLNTEAVGAAATECLVWFTQSLSAATAGRV